MSEVFTSDEELDALMRALAKTERRHEDLTGVTLGDFVIEQKLGEGGMGVVYRAHDHSLRRTVALKFMRLDARGDDDRQARFLREARAAAKLDHENIARVFAVSTDETYGAVIVLEYIEGQSLAEALPLEHAHAKQVARQIAAALAAAHAGGVVHRDLKPQNVMLDVDGNAKLLDFGLARELDGGETLTTLDGAILGTPRYMSPEQASGEKVDATSDVFSFGALLHETLSGAPAFAGDSDLAILDKVRFSRAARLPKNTPKRLRAVVDRCLEKSPGHRFKNGHALLNALEGRGRVKRWATRTAIALATVLLMGASSSGYMLWRWSQIGSDSRAWADVTKTAEDFSPPARAAYRRVAQSFFDLDHTSMWAAGTVAIFASGEALPASVRAYWLGDEAAFRSAVARAPPNMKSHMEIAQDITLGVSSVTTFHPGAHVFHGLDDRIEAELDNNDPPYMWRIFAAAFLDDRTAGIDRLRELIAMDDSVVAPHAILAQNLARLKRGDEALTVIANARRLHPTALALMGPEFEALLSLDRWDEAEAVAQKLADTEKKRVVGLMALREIALEQGDFERAEKMDEALEGLKVPGGSDARRASWLSYDIETATLGMPRMWKPLESEEERPGWEMMGYATRGRLAFMLGLLEPLDVAIARLRAGPMGGHPMRLAQRQAADLALFEVFRATLAKTPAPDAVARLQNANVEPYALNAALAGYHLALSNLDQAAHHINLLELPAQRTIPGGPPREWLRALLLAKLALAQGERSSAVDSLRRLAIADDACITSTNDRTRVCRIYAAEVDVLLAELEDEPSRVRRALSKFAALWPDPDPDLPLVRRANAARERW